MSDTEAMPDVGLSKPRKRRPLPAGYIRDHMGRLIELPEPMIRKEDAPCCRAKIDEIGRLPVGWCSPNCLRRIQRLSALL